MNHETMASPSAKRIEAMRSLVSEVIPTCKICGLTIRGHLFKHVAVTPITHGNSERSIALIQAVRDANWEALSKLQEWLGSATSADVIGLKCIDGQCSLAVLLCPAELDHPYALMLQELIGCDGPLVDSFWSIV
jgi:hypothetical protein